MVVILNDNDMSIAPPVGAMSAYLARILSGKTYRSFRRLLKDLSRHLPELARKSAANGRIYARFHDRRHAV